MRRRSGCLTIALLLISLFLVLLARGPGLRPFFQALLPTSLVSEVSVQTGTAVGYAATPTLTAAPRPTVPPTPVPSSPTPLPDVDTPFLQLSVTGRDGQPLERVIDGNAVWLVAQVNNPTAQSIADTVRFALQPLEAGAQPIATCRIEAVPGGTGRCSAPVAADGWAWQEHQRVSERPLFAALEHHPLSASIRVPVQPKPVVLVHGFNSGAWTWKAWTAPGGFLDARGLQGFAVGDGQFGIEPMDTGRFAHPHRPTKTIAENAAILARYVEAVRQATGAERVDLVAHSMGGLISRYYIATSMPLLERPGLPAAPVVNQLYMIGTPNAGSTCAIPPASLGLYPPATTELTPAYVQQIFNRTIRDPRGVPFFVLAGDPVRDFAALVCTSVPTDVFVSVASAAQAIPVIATELPVRHGEQTSSSQVFDVVFQSLSRGPEEYPLPMPTGSARPPAEMARLQLAELATGSLLPQGEASFSIAVEPAEAVSFVLYAPPDAVSMTVVSSRGQDIRPETAPTLPDVVIQKGEGPGAAMGQGIRVRRPAPGDWKVVLTSNVPPAGGETTWAVAVFVLSELQLHAEAEPVVVSAGQAVHLRASLTGVADPTRTTVSATMRDVAGQPVATVTLLDDGVHDDGRPADGTFGASWVPERPGLYTVTVEATGRRAQGGPFRRIAVVAVQAQR